MINSINPWNGFLELPYGYRAESGKNVSIEEANKLSIVYNCINIISQTAGALPFSVKRRTEEGKFDATDHPAYSLLKNKPNRYMTAMNFWMVVLNYLLSRGNSFVHIEKDDKGKISSFWPLDSRKMEIQMYEGEVFYRYGDRDKVFTPEEILHFKLYTQDGIVGISPIFQNAETIGAHIKQNSYSIKMLGEKPPGYLTDKTFSGPGGGKQKQRADANIENWQRQISSKGIAYLGGDVQYVPLMIPPDEAQYLGTSKKTKLEIMGMYRTPPEMHQIFEDSNNSLSENTALNFGKYCLTPIVTCLEQECNAKLFAFENSKGKDELFLKANMNAIYRADLKTTGEFMQTMVGAGIYNADKALSILDENPQPDGQGKEYYIQSAFMPKSVSREFWESKAAPSTKNPSEAAKSLSTGELYEIYLNKVKDGGEDE